MAKAPSTSARSRLAKLVQNGSSFQATESQRSRRSGACLRLIHISRRDASSVTSLFHGHMCFLVLDGAVALQAACA
ncbi:hypothetical protein M441DRAFT_61397 [Trichoderma asperellum CBS 433.97]|uniref:Uncharacterized protein n=1 Tax=Trichoderma asperellum (strain ATCC 204424 / CBS 433.97 / NBRC 101777) TaxID=1042311 RepID=A0A2T3YY47_TRIA4|nr:hypothetical protein M441DRAFT_61397 [Trichoderma asperellum CBS 433.97]PTB37468.1 hypothetical protein M441DRAFT_61397 [Trichoderma asperellum CBS 433.97]